MEHGAHTVQELCETVGYTERTIVKHLGGLSDHGLAVQRADGRWAPTDRRPV
ncbi:hypothetical protein [Streptomyces sp. NPDC002328]|uniref:hypothetical protein n=1 Tax=Streptomyces sp. NPDC002328 TaxID=3364642 RepID=UPI00368C5A7B